MYKQYIDLVEKKKLRHSGVLRDKSATGNEIPGKKIRKSYFSDLPSLPHLPHWQVLLVITITCDVILQLYIANFGKPSSRFPEITTTNLKNLLVWCLVAAFSLVFAIDTLAIMIHKYNQFYRLIIPFTPMPTTYIIIALVNSTLDIFVLISDLLYNIGHFQFIDTVQSIRLLGATRLYRMYIIFKYVMNSIYLHNKAVLLMYLIIILQAYTLIATLFTRFQWANVPEEHAKTAAQALYFLAPSINEVTFKTWELSSQFDIFLRAVFIGSSSVLRRGQVAVAVDSILTALLSQTTMLACLVFNIILISVFTIILVHSETKNVKYTATREEIRRRLLNIGTSTKTFIKVMKWYKTLWKYRRGIINTEAKKLLPSGIYRDCTLDTYWPAFKHSQLFRHMNIGFLNILSLKMETEFHCTGDIIYEKGMLRHSMYYIIQGIIHVMSVYDNSTPVISLFPGSCFGESTLLISYPCSITMICASYCELQVLKKARFIELLPKYPHEFKLLQAVVSSRYKKSEALFAMKKLKSFDDFNFQVGIHSVGTLNRIKRISRAIDRQMRLKNFGIYDHEDKVHKILNNELINPEYIGACSDYLDEIVISQVIDQNEVSCITSTCPIILHPDSPFVKIWNFIITIMVLVMVLIIPYEAGIDTKISTWQVTVSIVIQISFMVDLLMQCTFAVFLQDRGFKTMNTIFFYRISTWEYKADIAGSIPFNFLAVFYGVMNVNIWGLLKINYILRAWRFEKIFINHVRKTFSFRSFILISVYMGYFFVGLCYWGMVLNILSSFNNIRNEFGLWSVIENVNNDREDIDVIIKTIGFILIMTFGEGGLKIIPYTRREHVAVLLLNIFQFFVNSYFIAGVATLRVLLNRADKSKRETVTKIFSFMRKHNVPQILEYRVWRNLRVMGKIETDKFFKGTEDLKGLSHELTKEIKLNAWVKYLLKVPLFENTGKDFIMEIIDTCKVALYPENEFICFSGMLPHNFYIIKNGYCQIVTETGKPEQNKGPEWSFCVLECVLNIPVIKSIKTLTSCELIVIKYDDLQSIIKKYKYIEKTINSVKKQCMQLYQLPVIESIITHEKTDTESKSFYNFGYDMVAGTKAEHEFSSPYEKTLGGFFFLKYLLLRTVILPEGRMIWIIEIIRSILAFCSSTLFPAKLIILYSVSYSETLFVLLDICAYIDIYIHLHVAYYNEKGVLVTHPLMTSLHYIKTTFITDFIGCFPFERVLVRLIPYTSFQYWLCYNRVIQIHRLYGLLTFIKKGSNKPRISLIIAKCIILLFVSINLFASIAFSQSCTLSEEIQVDKDSYVLDKLDCPNIEYNPIVFGSTVNPIKMYFLFQFYATTLVTQANILSFGDWDKDRSSTILICFCGYAILIYTYGEIMATVFTQKTGMKYQIHIRSLMKHLEICNVPAELKEEFYQYYNLLWDVHQGQNPNNTLSVFSFALKNDLINFVYGKNLREHTIFSGTSNFFFQSLIMIFKPEVFHKDSQILIEGFVHGNIYIVNEGYIKVLSGHRPLMTVGKGAIFGNLFEVPLSQQSLTIIAHSTVEVLTTTTMKFYSILNGYPQIEKILSRYLTHLSRQGICVVAGHTDGVENILQEEEIPVRGTENKLTSAEVQWAKAIIDLMNTVITMYIIALHEFTISSLLICYVLDFLTVGSIMMSCMTPYKDTDGEFVTDLKSIKDCYRKNKDKFLFDVASVFPFETLWFLFGNATYAYFYLRANRILRYFRFASFISVQEKRITDSQTKTAVLHAIFNFYAFVYLFVCIVLLIHTNSLSSEDLTSYDRLALFSQTIVAKLSALANYPTEFVLPCKTNALVFCHSLQMMIGVIIKAVLMGHFLFYAEVYLSHILNFIQARNDIIRELQIRRVAMFLVKKVESFLRYLWDFNAGTHVPFILSQAPIPLQLKLMRTLYKHHLTNHPIFSKCGDTFLDQLLLHLKVEIISPGNTIIKKGVKDNNTYFIHLGKVIKYESELYKDVKVMSQNGSFGHFDDDHVTEIYSFKTLTGVTVLVLNYNAWSYLLDHFPAEKKIFAAFDDKLRKRARH